MNCKRFILKCQAACCGLVPIHKTFFEEYSPLRKVFEYVSVQDGFLLAVTDDGHCTYLTYDLKCSIYEHRPPLCQKYGNETHLLMTCPWQRTNGIRRNKHDRDKLAVKLQTIKILNKNADGFDTCSTGEEEILKAGVVSQ